MGAEARDAYRQSGAVSRTTNVRLTRESMRPTDATRTFTNPRLK
jgi:hypothetical protein